MNDPRIQHINSQAKQVNFAHTQNIIKSLKIVKIDDLPIIGRNNRKNETNDNKWHCAHEAPENNQRYREKVETYQTNIKTMKKVILVLYRNPKGGRRPKAAAPLLGGGRSPPVKDKDAFCFIIFDIYSTVFDIFQYR